MILDYRSPWFGLNVAKSGLSYTGTWQLPSATNLETKSTKLGGRKKVLAIKTRMHPIFFALVRKIDSFFCQPREKSVFDIDVVFVVFVVAVVVVVVVAVVVVVVVVVVVPK